MLDASAIFTVAYLLRLLYLYQVARSPLFDFLELDPRYYHDWAVAIANGNWIGQAVFEQAPLYPYLLAVYFLIFGHDLWLLRLLQIGAGAGTCVLTYLLGLRLFDRRAGVLAGLACAAYGPFFFYEGQVMKEFLTLPLGTGALLLLLHKRPPPRLATFSAGACIALAALVRDNFLLLLPVLAGWILYESRWRIPSVIPFLLGGMLVLLPVGIRNYSVGGDLVLTTSGGGEVFYIGNGPHADGTYRPPPWVRPNPLFEHADFRRKANELTGRVLTRAEASHFWWKQGVYWILDHPVRAVQLWVRKFALFWNDHELPDNYSFYTFRRLSWVLAHTLTFGPVAALAWAGVVLSAHEWRRLLPVYLAGLGYMMSVLLMFNFGRFRLPLVPVLMVFAAHGVSQAWDMATRWRSGGSMNHRTMAAAVVLAVALPFVHIRRPGTNEDPLAENLRVGAAYLQAGEANEAMRVFREIVAGVEALARQRSDTAMKDIENPTAGRAVVTLAAAHANLAGLLRLEGKLQEAAAEYRRSTYDVAAEEYRLEANLSTSDPSIHISLGKALLAVGNLDQAAVAFRRAVAVDPTSVEARLELANAYYEKGRLPDALEALREVSELPKVLTPVELAHYHFGVGLALYKMPDRQREAVEHLTQALQLGPDAPQAPEVRQLLNSVGPHAPRK